MRKENLLKLGALLLFFIPFTSKSQSTYLVIPDTRSVATAPGDYVRSLKSDFKMGTSVGLPDATYYTLVGLRGWSDDSGGPAHEMAFSNSKGIYYRTGTLAAGWGIWRKILVENTAGNVGIGTDVPKEKLSVNGKIRAQEVKVETANWPDYVFTDEYQLPTLKETAEFIEKNKHLPGVPKAAEVEENGLSLGEMNKILMQKVEELTLHLIEKDKKIEKQDEILSNVLERLKKLER